MNNYTLDIKDLTALDAQLKTVGRVLDKRVLGAAFKISLAPMLNAARREAPESNNGAQYIRLKSATKSNDYRRGGATKADARIKIVDGVGDEAARGLVGISKQSGKVGWRTVFITRGTKARYNKKGAFRGRMKANDFLGRAASQTFSVTVSLMSIETQKVVNRALNRAK